MSENMLREIVLFIVVEPLLVVRERNVDKHVPFIIVEPLLGVREEMLAEMLPLTKRGSTHCTRFWIMFTMYLFMNII